MSHSTASTAVLSSHITASTPAAYSPPPLASPLSMGTHAIYRGLTRRSMEYVSLSHSKNPDAAHSLKGEILISSRTNPGYIQYTVTMNEFWMTSKVILTSKFAGQERKLILEVDQDRRWYKVTEPRLARTKSFYRPGSSASTMQSSSSSSSSSNSSLSSAINIVPRAGSSRSHCSMTDTESTMSDSASCYSSSSDSESLPMEKLNLNWSAPSQKAQSLRAKRASLIASRNGSSASSISSSLSLSSSPTTSTAPTSPGESINGTEQKTIKNSNSTSSLLGPKIYEHLPHLDGCMDFDLGRDISPSTFLLPLRRAALDKSPAEISATEPSFNSALTALVSFPDLALGRTTTHFAYAGPGFVCDQNTMVKTWRDRSAVDVQGEQEGDEEDDDESNAVDTVEVDAEGLVVRYGRDWARIPSV